MFLTVGQITWTFELAVSFHTALCSVFPYWCVFPYCCMLCLSILVYDVLPLSNFSIVFELAYEGIVCIVFLFMISIVIFFACVPLSSGHRVPTLRRMSACHPECGCAWAAGRGHGEWGAGAPGGTETGWGAAPALLLHHRPIRGKTSIIGIWTMRNHAVSALFVYFSS